MLAGAMCRPRPQRPSLNRSLHQVNAERLRVPLTRAGRAGRARNVKVVGGVEESDSDDDLEVTWESDTPDAAEGTDDAISDKPVASEGSSPSTVISRPGSFGGGESISPSDSSNSSRSSSNNSIDSERQ